MRRRLGYYYPTGVGGWQQLATLSGIAIALATLVPVLPPAMWDIASAELGYNLSF